MLIVVVIPRVPISVLPLSPGSIVFVVKCIPSQSVNIVMLVIVKNVISYFVESIPTPVKLVFRILIGSVLFS